MDKCVARRASGVPCLTNTNGRHEKNKSELIAHIQHHLKKRDVSKALAGEAVDVVLATLGSGGMRCEVDVAPQGHSLPAAANDAAPARPQRGVQFMYEQALVRV